jgi:hypothetical protein
MGVNPVRVVLALQTPMEAPMDFLLVLALRPIQRQHGRYHHYSAPDDRRVRTIYRGARVPPLMGVEGGVRRPVR